MCAIAIQNRYVVTARGLELKQGARFTVRPGPIKSGNLCLARIGPYLVCARWFSVEGVNWLISPGRWIWIPNPSSIHILGAVA